MERKYNVITVTELATKKLIKIKDYRFNPELHAMIDEAKVIATDEGKSYVCEECGKVFKTEAALKGHKTKYHSK